MSAHTPTPWVCEQMGRKPEPPEVATVCHVGEWVVGVHTPGYPGGDYRYIDCGDPAGADDAAFIVRACNSFDALTSQNKALCDLLHTAATAFRTGFLPPEDWLPRAHELLGLPPTTRVCTQRESSDILKLRRMLAFAYSRPGALYGDDGELQDNSARPFIDYLRMSVDEIEQAIRQRGATVLASLPQSQEAR